MHPYVCCVVPAVVMYFPVLNCCVFVEQKKRVSLLMAAGLLEGATLGPMIHLAIEINPRYIFPLLSVSFQVQ